MAMFLDLVRLSYQSLRRWHRSSALVVSLAALSTVGGLILLGVLQTSSILNNPAAQPAEGASLIRLGRSWSGSEREVVSEGHISSLTEVLQRLGCKVSPVFVYGDEEEKQLSIGESEYYIRSGLIGVSSDYLDVVSPVVEVVEGRFFDAAEVNSAARVAVVGNSTASLMHESAGSNLPAQFQIAGVAYEVIGIVAEGPGLRSRYGDISIDERIIFPYTTLVEDLAAFSDYRLELDAIVYRRSDSISSEFIDRLINDWLRQTSLVGDRYVSHFRSQPFSASARPTASLSLTSLFVLLAWIILFSAMPAAILGYLRTSERAEELRLLLAVGASPLHLTLQIALETLVLTFTGAAVGLLLTRFLVQPVFAGLSGLALSVQGGFKLAFLTGLAWFLACNAGSLRFLVRVGA